jgi:hypothetical protein
VIFQEHDAMWAERRSNAGAERTAADQRDRAGLEAKRAERPPEIAPDRKFGR